MIKYCVAIVLLFAHKTHADYAAEDDNDLNKLGLDRCATLDPSGENCASCKLGFVFNRKRDESTDNLLNDVGSCGLHATGRCTIGDCESGRGRFEYDSGDVYDGEWKLGGAGNGAVEPNRANGLKHGPGKYIYASGNVYFGEWEGGKKHGQGKFTFLDGAVHYEGEWSDNEPVVPPTWVLMEIFKTMNCIYLFLGFGEYGDRQKPKKFSVALSIACIAVSWAILYYSGYLPWFTSWFVPHFVLNCAGIDYSYPDEIQRQTMVSSTSIPKEIIKTIVCPIVMFLCVQLTSAITKGKDYKEFSLGMKPWLWFAVWTTILYYCLGSLPPTLQGILRWIVQWIVPNYGLNWEVPNYVPEIIKTFVCFHLISRYIATEVEFNKKYPYLFYPLLLFRGVWCCFLYYIGRLYWLGPFIRWIVPNYVVDFLTTGN